MKFSLISTLFLTGLTHLASACEADFLVIICFSEPNCQGDRWEVNGADPSSMIVQQCLTNNGYGNMEGMIGPGPGGGGASCFCEEADGSIACATFDEFNRYQHKAVASVRPTYLDGGGVRHADLSPTVIIIIKIIILIIGPIYIKGDPHVKGWNGRSFDWHGQCDNVMLHAPNFAFGMGLEMHTRTKIRYDYSYIESAALKLGDDILEVSGYGEFFVNGVESADVSEISDFPFTHEMMSVHDHLFTIDLGDGASITVRTHNDIVGIGLNPAKRDIGLWFSNSTGLMGDFETGALLARDGVTVLEDPNDMGQEWQVRDTDPKLFQDMERKPQFPEKCIMPSPNAKETRRLGENISLEAAEKACSHWKTEDEKDQCIFDVLATGDLGMAAVGAF